MRDDASEDEISEYRTRRLRMRLPHPSDAAALALAVGNPRVAMSLFDVPYPYRHGDAEGWIERARAGSTSPGTTLVAISLVNDGLVGAGFHRPSETGPDGREISFWVAEPFWGRGYGTEIAHAVIDHAFEAGAADRLWCAIRVTSGPARRVAEKCGFQFRDTGMVRSLATRGTVPVERFVLERHVWASLKDWGRERGRSLDADRRRERSEAGARRGYPGMAREARKAKDDGDASDAA